MEIHAHRIAPRVCLQFFREAMRKCASEHARRELVCEHAGFHLAVHNKAGKIVSMGHSLWAIHHLCKKMLKNQAYVAMSYFFFTKFHTHHDSHL